jgi:hypothetical protein
VCPVHDTSVTSLRCKCDVSATQQDGAFWHFCGFLQRFRVIRNDNSAVRTRYCAHVSAFRVHRVFMVLVVVVSSRINLPQKGYVHDDPGHYADR